MKNISKLLLAVIMALSLAMIACSDGSSNETTSGGGGVTDTNLILPEGPTPKVTEADGRLILSWSAVKGAKAYQIYRSEFNNTETPTPTSIGYTTETNYVIPNLSNGTTYFVWVKAWQAYNDNTYKSGPFGKMGKGTPKLADAAPAKVTGLKADVKQVSIKLSWTEIPAASSYTVQIKESGSFYNLVGYENLLSSTITITDLEPSTEYTYRVVARNTKDYGPDSDEITKTTLAPYSLTKNTWNNRNIGLDDGAHVYEFTIPAQTTYGVQWNDERYGDNTKTGRIAVSALWADTKTSLSWSAGINSWNSPRAINNNTDAERTVRISVVPYASGQVYTYKGGTYGIHYFDASDAALYIPPFIDEVNFAPPNKVHVKWNEINDADGYNVYRSTSLNGKYSKIATIVSVEYPVIGTYLATEYTDTGVSAGTTYYYAVSATIADKEGPRSVPATAITIPTATSLLADTEYINTSSTDHLYTFAVTANQTYVFDIRKTSGDGTLYWDVYSSSGTKIPNLDQTNNDEYTPTANDTLYIVLAPMDDSLTYRIKIYNKALAKPQNIPVVTVDGKKEGEAYNVNVKWSYSGTDSGTLTGFEIYRSSTSEFSGYTNIHSAEATADSWTDTVTLGNTYYYRIAAKNANGEGSQSVYKSVTIAIPGVPTNIRVVPSFDIPTSGRVNVTWSSVIGATQYRVYRLTADTYNYITTVTAGTTYTDTTAVFGNVYSYKIAAENDYGQSAQSEAVSGGDIQKLTDGTWFDATLTAGIADWYAITVTEDKVYRVWWLDTDNNFSTGAGKTVDVKVSAYFANNAAPITGFNGVDSGNTAQFTALSDTTVYIKVQGYSATGAGTYSVVYTEGDDDEVGKERPAL